MPLQSFTPPGVCGDGCGGGGDSAAGGGDGCGANDGTTDGGGADVSGTVPADGGGDAAVVPSSAGTPCPGVAVHAHSAQPAQLPSGPQLHLVAHGRVSIAHQLRHGGGGGGGGGEGGSGGACGDGTAVGDAEGGGGWKGGGGTAQCR